MSVPADSLEAYAEALGRVLAETSADLVCLASARGGPFYLNPAGRKLLGLDENSRPTSLRLQTSTGGLLAGAARRGRAGRQQDRPLGRPQPAPQRADRRASSTCRRRCCV